MKAIKNKIRSRRGASITFALLLFLVCAVISSVVIVAASTSGGRLSELAVMDQRYYAVNSAAELLCDVFVNCDTEVTLTCNASGNVTAPAANPSGVDPIVFEADKLLAKALLTKTDADPVEMDLTTNVTDDPLKCKVTETVGKNGLLVFKVKNNADSNNYTLMVTLASDVKKIVNEESSSITVYGWKLHSIKRVRADDAD